MRHKRNEKSKEQNERDNRALSDVSLGGLKVAAVTAMTAFTLTLAVGCSESPGEPEIVDNPNNTEEFGGYTATSEAPAFGSAELVEIEAEEEGVVYNDPLLSPTAGVEEIGDPEATRYGVRILWGKLRFDSTVTTATDWAGSLTISRGAEVVRRTIRFEPATDEVLPRVDRKLIEWNSMTTVHNDGLLVEIFNPRRPDSVRFDSVWVVDSVGESALSVDTTLYRDPLSLTFATVPVTVSFTGAELARLDTVIFTPDSNAVLIQSTRIDERVCPRGHLAGHWGFNEEGRGVFRGAWMSALGKVVGHLKGHWGLNDEGRRMFWGKWISADGAFEGFVRGAWGPYPESSADEAAFRHAAGWFAGQIFNAERFPIGYLRGQYDHGSRDSASVDSRGGHFAGKWKLNCPAPDDRAGGDDMGDRDDSRGTDVVADEYINPEDGF